MLLPFVISHELPLTDPVLKFLLILVIILSAPLLLNKLKIPHLLGLIIAGAIIGPNGLNLVFGIVVLFYRVQQVCCTSYFWPAWKSTWGILRKIVAGVSFSVCIRSWFRWLWESLPAFTYFIFLWKPPSYWPVCSLHILNRLPDYQ